MRLDSKADVVGDVPKVFVSGKDVDDDFTISPLIGNKFYCTGLLDGLHNHTVVTVHRQVNKVFGKTLRPTVLETTFATISRMIGALGLAFPLAHFQMVCLVLQHLAL